MEEKHGKTLGEDAKTEQNQRPVTYCAWQLPIRKQINLINQSILISNVAKMEDLHGKIENEPKT